MSIESVMPSNHLILCCPLLLLPSIFPSIRVFSNELVLRMRWPEYWSFSFRISPSNEYSGLTSFRMDWLDLLAVQGTLNSLLQHNNFKASILGAQPSLGFPRGSDGNKICLQCGRPRFNCWVGKIPWRRKWHSTPVLLPGESHGGRSLVGCSPWGHKELDTTERCHFTRYGTSSLVSSHHVAQVLEFQLQHQSFQ